MQTLMPLQTRRHGAMNLVYGVVALVAFFVITGVGLIIIYSSKFLRLGRKISPEHRFDRRLQSDGKPVRQPHQPLQLTDGSLPMSMRLSHTRQNASDSGYSLGGQHDHRRIQPSWRPIPLRAANLDDMHLFSQSP